MISKNEFIKSLKEIIKKDDKVIVIYSNASRLLSKFKYNKNLVSQILDLIESFVSKDRTLILPSFSANVFIKTRKFDLQNSIDNIGVLSKEALKRDYYRTPQPLHSYLVFGKKKIEVQNLSFRTSWGQGSILDFMSKHNARICALDLPWNKGCSYLHKFEEDYQVPWRYFKKYIGKMYLNKKYISKCEELKYSLPKIDRELYDHYPFIKYIKKSKSFRKNSCKDFKIESVKSSCLDKIGRNLFLNDPWCIIKEKRILINWIKNEKIKNVIKNI